MLSTKPLVPCSRLLEPPPVRRWDGKTMLPLTISPIVGGGTAGNAAAAVKLTIALMILRVVRNCMVFDWSCYVTLRRRFIDWNS
jgi:hypothetical protein